MGGGGGRVFKTRGTKQVRGPARFPPIFIGGLPHALGAKKNEILVRGCTRAESPPRALPGRLGVSAADAGIATLASHSSETQARRGSPLQ